MLRIELRYPKSEFRTHVIKGRLYSDAKKKEGTEESNE
jgi:hypothetical protein